MSKRSVEVEVDGRQLKLSNLDKVFYPDAGFTKGQVIDYYTRIAPVLLPHLKGRPLTMKRYPDGVEGKFFYEKNAPGHMPDWIETVAVKGSQRTVNYIVANELPTLVWLANMADLELHTSLSMAKVLETPTVIAFDLDPGPPAGLREAGEVALLLRDTLSRLGLESFVKTSGSKGMQVYAPLNEKGITYSDTKPFAHALAKLLEKHHPEMIVSKMKKELRASKVFIDWSQNDQKKTTVNVYSLRARPQPTVSTPLDWDELEAAVAEDRIDDLRFTSDQVIERADELGDLFAPVLKLKQKLPEL